MVPVRRQAVDERSFSHLKRDAAAAARALVVVLERDNVSIATVRNAERRTSRVLAELRMVAAALADSHSNAE